jgi:hypothetical protein
VYFSKKFYHFNKNFNNLVKAKENPKMRTLTNKEIAELLYWAETIGAGNWGGWCAYPLDNCSYNSFDTCHIRIKFDEETEYQGEIFDGIGSSRHAPGLKNQTYFSTLEELYHETGDNTLSKLRTETVEEKAERSRREIWREKGESLLLSPEIVIAGTFGNRKQYSSNKYKVDFDEVTEISIPVNIHIPYHLNHEDIHSSGETMSRYPISCSVIFDKMWEILGGYEEANKITGVPIKIDDKFAKLDDDFIESEIARRRKLIAPLCEQVNALCSYLLEKEVTK